MASPAPAPAGDIGNHALPEAIIILTGIIASLAVVIRLASRVIMDRLSIADLFLVISMAFYLAHHYNSYQAAIYPGFGVHQWQYNPKLATASHYNFKLGSVYFGLNIAFLKIAILLDWLHVFVPRGTRSLLFWILHGLIWGNAIFYLIGTFIQAFQCAPQDVGTRRCPVNVANYNQATGIINVISDLTIIIAPHCVIWRLNMSRTKKIGVSLLFLIGFVATGSAIARVVYVTRAFQTNDILYYSVMINFWAISEQTAGYLVIGIPAVPKVIQSLRRVGRPRTPRQYGKSENGSTWPSSTARERRDPWGDTHLLVPMEGEVIQTPNRACLHGDRQRRTLSDPDLEAAEFIERA